MTRIIFLFLCLGVSIAAASYQAPHFRKWFPQMAQELEWTLQHNCSKQYQIYLKGQYENYENPLHRKPSKCTSCAIAPVAECLLDNVWGLGASNMQAAGVVLGILPTLLTFVGISKVETGMIALRRPVLAFFISISSPAVNPLRTFDYKDPENILQKWEGSKEHRIPRNRWAQSAIVAVQYLIVIGAVANVVDVSLQLSYWTVCSFAPETDYLPWMWVVLTIVAYVLGAIAVRLRICLSDWDRKRYEQPGPWLDRLLSECRLWIAREFHLSSRENPEILVIKNETYPFLITNWWLSTLASVHIIYGTLVFSSILFISTADAAFVAFRFVMSTLAARLVLIHELCGFRHKTEEGRKVEQQSQADSGSVSKDDQKLEEQIEVTENKPFLRFSR